MLQARRVHDREALIFFFHLLQLSLFFLLSTSVVIIFFYFVLQNLLRSRSYEVGCLFKLVLITCNVDSQLQSLCDCCIICMCRVRQKSCTIVLDKSRACKVIYINCDPVSEESCISMLPR